MYENLTELSREIFYRYPGILSDWPDKAELFETTLKQAGLPIRYYDSEGFFNIISTQYRGYEYFFNKLGDDITYDVYFANYISKIPAGYRLKLLTIINSINYSSAPVSIHIDSSYIEVRSRVYTHNGQINFTAFRDWMRAGDATIRGFITAVRKDAKLMKYINFI